MADFKKALDKVLKWEGGYSNDVDDPGGETNFGITQRTYSTYYSGSVRNITKEQVETIYRVYWNRMKGDQINSQSVAELAFDFSVNSGSGTAIIKLQRLVGVKDDGVFGNETLKAVNAKNPQVLFNELYDVRVAYYKAIVARRPSNQKFLSGWMNRLRSYKFEQ